MGRDNLGGRKVVVQAPLIETSVMRVKERVAGKGFTGGALPRLSGAFYQKRGELGESKREGRMERGAFLFFSRGAIGTGVN